MEVPTRFLKTSKHNLLNINDLNPSILLLARMDSCNRLNEAAHYGTFAFRPKSDLSFLDFGLDTYTRASVYLEGHRQNDAKFSAAEDATVLIRLGEMTVAFVLQLLIPLLIIFLCFSTFTREREENTLKMLVSQGASMADLYWGKVLGYSRIVGL